MRLRFIFFFLLLSFCSLAQSYYMFVGTYTSNGSKGIYVYRFDAATGKASWVSNTDSAANPSYLTVAPDLKYVYAVNEVGGGGSGQVSAFSFDRATGKLSLINQQSSGGADPCYVSVTRGGEWVFVANYSGGSLAAFPVNKDGSLQPYAQLIQDTGSGINKERQERAHVHSAVLSPDQNYLFSADLGTDKETIYKLNTTAEQPLQPATVPFVMIKKGSGPRHLTFHPNKKFAYLIEELSGTVEFYKYNSGTLTFVQRVATHPADYKGTPGSADVHVSPDGRFLYASNRGDENNITIFSINQNNGQLRLKGYQSTMGITPRNFAIDPTGHYLVVANQKSDNVVVFKRNAQTGLLQPTGSVLKVPSPVCLQFAK